MRGYLHISMTYQLSVAIFGPGISEHAHWGFVIHQSPSPHGDLLHVRLIDIPSNRFIFENRSGHGLESQNAWGLCKISLLDHAQRSKVISILSSEKPPSGGTKDCQDWVIDALVTLEVEELVPARTAHNWSSRIGKQTDAIKSEVGINWNSLNGR